MSQPVPTPTASETTQQGEVLLHAPLARLYKQYALPSVVTMVFFGLQSLVDGYIAGNYIGAYALGGTNIVGPIFSLLMVVSLSVGIGCQTIIGHGLGAGDRPLAQRAMSTGVWALVVFALVGTIVLMLYAEEIVVWMGADETLAPYAIAYLRGLAPFMVPMSLCFYSDLMLKALGHPIYSSIVMGAAVLLNIALGIYFVIHLELGTYGTALSTGIAFSCALVASGWKTFDPRQPISMLRGRVDLPLLGRAVFNGASEGVSELAAGLSMLIINLLVMQRLGAEGVSAYTTLNYLNFIGILLFLGISDGLIPVMSYLYGAKARERLHLIVRTTLIINAIIGLGVFAGLMLGGEYFVRIFLSDESSTTFRLANEGLEVYAFVFLLSGFNIFVTSFFTSIGNAVGSIVIALLRGLVFLVVGMLTLPAIWGDKGLWLSIPLAELLTLLVSLCLLTRKLKHLLR